VEDPAAFVGPPDAQRRLFTRVYFELEARIKIFSGLSLDDVDSVTLRRRLGEIGRLPPGSPAPASA
jgi:arsenate reductase